MGERGKRLRTAIGLVAVSMLMAPAATAQAKGAELRFVHAAPGAGRAVLEVDGKKVGSPVAFGEVGDYARAPDGRVELSVVPESGGKALGTGTGELGPGRHTAIAWLRNGKFELSVIDDARAVPGRARLRAVHAAGELGRASVQVDGRSLGQALSPGDATPYEALEPGSYELKVIRASGGGAPLAAKPGVRLAAGTSSTALVMGGGGKPVQVVLASDATASPARAPATGLGGLDGGTDWLALVLAALAAGGLGGGAYRLLTRRRVA
jgi:uncharacterized protein DUF4397